MNVLNLKKSLEDKVLPFYIITGEDFYYRAEAMQFFKSLVDDFAYDFNLTYCDVNVSPESLMVDLSTPPLMTGKRVVYLKSDGKKIDKDKLKKFESVIKNWIANPCPDVVLVAINDEDNFKSLLKVAEVVDCSKQDTGVLQNEVKNIIKKNGYNIDNDLIVEIIERCNNDMQIIANELNKLFSYCDNKCIDKDAVDNIVVSNIEQDVFKLTDNIAVGNTEKAYKIMENLLAKGEQPVKILALIASQYRRMFICKVSTDSDAVIASQLGIKPYAVSIAKRTAKLYKPMQLKRLVDKLQLIEYQTKNGQLSMNDGLNLALSFVMNRR